MKLIDILENGGYPTEYLLARLRGRRTKAFSAWDEIIFHADPSDYLLKTQYGEFTEKYAAEGVWIQLLREYQWVYRQMNNTVKYTFIPFFSFCEIQTLLACLRYKSEKDTGGQIGHLLTFSLLSHEIKEILISKEDLPETVKALDNYILDDVERAGHLSHTLSTQGMTGVEQGLTALFFEKLEPEAIHPVLCIFFSFMVDALNLISLYKHIRWGIEAPLQLKSGGKIRSSGMNKILLERDMEAVTRLIKKMTGKELEDQKMTRIEHMLYDSLTNRIHTAARDEPETGFILHYLWSVYMEVQNLSIILRGKHMERDVLREELTGL